MRAQELLPGDSGELWVTLTLCSWGTRWATAQNGRRGRYLADGGGTSTPAGDREQLVDGKIPSLAGVFALCVRPSEDGETLLCVLSRTT